MNAFIIPLNGWAAGERKFHFRADTEFFHSFGNTEILDADVNAEATVLKKDAHKVEAVLHLKGTVTVPCDRCLEPVALSVDATPSEVLTPGEGEVDWNLSQAVYDYVCVSLPLQKVHPEGTCNPDTVRFLGQLGRGNEEAEASDANSPFAALKGLFDAN
jgi:uncharacterized metal-binding protein YceD (DUF177 family)